MIGLIGRFSTQLVIAPSLSSTIYKAHAKSFPVFSVFINSCLVTASNNGYSSAFGLKSPTNGGSLPIELSHRVRITLQLAVYRGSVIYNCCWSSPV
jgi:hypothetical protein